jgi:hypothetical protein
MLNHKREGVLAVYDHGELKSERMEAYRLIEDAYKAILQLDGIRA